ncbi:MAG: LacI family DNA-binding transcriptional regulator [Candidatus Omnitrophica bacterium]|nr:LacI family DNA-binding transcriptional regulator [Candidatus Omnitrophota bacterium]
MQKKKASISDVARRAKVSIATVSRVINNLSTVAPENRAKVEEAIAHLKFIPNISAQRLASGHNNSIGLVMPGYPGMFHSFYAIEIIRGIGHACETLNLDLVFHITNGFNPINYNAVGGIIFADIIENRRQVEEAVSLGIPCMIINNQADELEVDYIAVDNRLGGEIAADYLYSLGHRKIATVTGNLNTQSGALRFEGFKNYLDNKKCVCPETFIFKGDYSRRSAHMAIEQFLALGKDRPTSIFAASDEMASEMIGVIMENGLKVPDDISVIGFDDGPSCLFGTVGLTTVKQPLFEMAEKAVRLLHNVIQHKDQTRQRLTLPPQLVIRESCGSFRK